MKENFLYIILASFADNVNGYWIIDTTRNEDPTLDNKNIIECHRKELIGEESAKDILFAINLNLENLNNEIRKEGYHINSTPKGISYDIPLNVLEEIFDFWSNTYKNSSSWKKCIGILKMKRRVLLSDLIRNKGVKGNLREWGPTIDKLHSYRPNQSEGLNIKVPMW